MGSLSIETTLSLIKWLPLCSRKRSAGYGPIEYSAVCARLLGTLDSGLYKNPRT